MGITEKKNHNKAVFSNLQRNMKRLDFGKTCTTTTCAAPDNWRDATTTGKFLSGRRKTSTLVDVTLDQWKMDLRAFYKYRIMLALRHYSSNDTNAESVFLVFYDFYYEY